jgi:hypothetical protein
MHSRNISGARLSRTDRMKIIHCLHSDHVQDPAEKRRHDEALQIFNALTIETL